jgi:hypothetical protein
MLDDDSANETKEGDDMTDTATAMPEKPAADTEEEIIQRLTPEQVTDMRRRGIFLSRWTAKISRGTRSAW